MIAINEQQKSLLLIHTSVLLFGLTGLFAKAITIPTQYIVLGRVFFAALSMGIFFLLSRKDIRLSSKADAASVFILGLVLAAHWFSFFISVKISTVAIGLLAFSTYPLFVAFFEPVLFHERFRPCDLAAAFVILIGVAFIVPSFDLGNNITVGILWGMASSVTYAVLSLYNRKLVARYNGAVVAFYEQASAAIAMLPMLFLFSRPEVTAKDWGLMILLGVVFTGMAHSMFISGMKYVRAQTAGVISGLETVYGVAAAALVLGEVPSAKEAAGGALILGAALFSTLFASKGKN